MQNNRAKKLGLPATLTVYQWLAILNLFCWQCAYCRKEPYSAIDHFLPVRLGGGTIITNCVPACRTCNRLKWGHHPDEVTTLPIGAIEQVRLYLERYHEFSTLSEIASKTLDKIHIR